jgi:hypothetical protein
VAATTGDHTGGGPGGIATAGGARPPGARARLRAALTALHLDGLYALYHRATRLDPRRQWLAARFRRWNRGAAPQEMVVRPGLRLRIDPRSREPFEWFCFRSVEMAHELDAFVRAMAGRQRFLDVGACHGIFALVFAHRRPAVRAVAADPSAVAHEILAANAALDGLGNVLPLRVACGAATGTLRMRQVWHHLEALPEQAPPAAAAGGEAPDGGPVEAGAGTGMAGPAVHEPAAGVAVDEPVAGAADDAPAAGAAVDAPEVVEVPMRSIDDLCGEMEFQPDLIKIDVEGYELGVIQGARATLERHRPLIFLEIHPDHLRRLGHSPRQVVELLAGLGYRFHGLGGAPLSGARVAGRGRVSRIVCGVPGRAGGAG